MASIDAALTLVTFHPGATPHIVIDHEQCACCSIGRVCEAICPAQNYKWDALARRMHVSTSSCFECGTCRISCTEDAITWHWPMGGFGVMYVEG